MAVPRRDCPPESMLGDFGLGMLDDARATTVSEHLETCVDCRRRVANLPGDSFIDRLRAARGSAGGEPRMSGQRVFDDSLVQSPSRADSVGTIAPANAGSRTAQAATALGAAPTELANHPDYELIEELGRGGMGTVYLAKNRLMDRLEVLKVVSNSLLIRPGSLERFQQEIRSAAKLNHPNIVTAYSVLRAGDLLAFAMEYVRGQDLSQVVAARGALPIANATFYAYQVALGLEHARERGMVHRDVKPNNLMLTVEGEKHVVKILDFGLAKATSEKAAETRLTESGQMLGTPDYVAPEQTLDAQTADIRADIYSLGCTLYFLLSGGPPFTETNLYGVLEAHQKRDPRALNIVRPDVPVELAAVTAKMLAKDPAGRYQTPLEAARALAPFFKPGHVSRTAGEYATHVPQADAATAPSPASDAERSRGTSLETRRSVLRRLSEGSARSSRKMAAIAIPSLAAGAVLLLGITLLVRTPRGMIEIELSDPDAKVSVTVDEDRVDVAGLNEPLSLEVGDHALVVRGPGYETVTKLFKVTRGKNAPLTVSLVSSRRDLPDKHAPRPTQNQRESLLAVAPFNAEQARSHQASWAKRLGTPIEQENSIGMRLVLIPPGEFTMGSTPEQIEEAKRFTEQLGQKLDSWMLSRLEDELPAHRVTISRPFLIGAAEVTIGQFRRFVDTARYVTEGEQFGGGNSSSTNENDPEKKQLTWQAPGFAVAEDSNVSQVTRNDATAFCNWLSETEKLSPCYRKDARGDLRLVDSGLGYRLPTEAEWEYACRAGSTTQFSFGDDPTEFPEYGWSHKFGRIPRPLAVATKLPNGFGLYDMHGSVFEWCHDWYARDYYSHSPAIDPMGPLSGEAVRRSGQLGGLPLVYCRSAFRAPCSPYNRTEAGGFRVVRVSTNAKAVDHAR